MPWLRRLCRKVQIKSNHNGIILASGSPRRKELLKLIVNEFEVCASDIDEKMDLSLCPGEQVMELARAKADDILKKRPASLIISADTLVYLSDTPLGKPRDRKQAFEMLRALSGKEHAVYTGICICKEKKRILDYEKTSVYFSELSDSEINDYLDTGEYKDKAGAYAIQGYASKFVYKIEGCYFNIVGLPISRLYQHLKQFNL